jgi:hypothetical protein
MRPIENVNDDGPAAETHRVARGIESQIDAVAADRPPGVAGQRMAVAGDIEAGAERDIARVDGHDSVAGGAARRRHPRAARTSRGVRRRNHSQRGVGEPHGSAYPALGDARERGVIADALGHHFDAWKAQNSGRQEHPPRGDGVIRL